MSDICRNCGEVMEDGAKFCGSCGAKVEPVTEAPVEAPVEAPAAEVPAEAPAAEAPVYEAPASFSAPEQPESSAPVYEAPDPVYPTPDQPGYTVPEMPDRCPDEPPHGAPGQYFYGAPAQQPPYSAPAQPANGAPVQQPHYGAPMQQPSYGAPMQQPAGSAPAQPANGASVQQPPYGAPAQPPYGAQPQPYAPTGAQPGYGATGQAGQPQYYAPNGAQPQPTKKKGKVGLIIGIIVGAIVIIAGVVLLLNPGIFGTSGGSTDPSGTSTGTVSDKGFATAEDAVAAYVKGIEAMGKGEGSFSDAMSNCYEIQYAKSAYKSTIQEMLEEQDESLENTFSIFSAYEFSCTYKLKDTRTMTSSEQDSFISENMIDTYCETSSVEEICVCDVTLTMSFSSYSSDSDMELTCIKADGRWFLSLSGIES